MGQSVSLTDFSDVSHFPNFLLFTLITRTLSSTFAFIVSLAHLRSESTEFLLKMPQLGILENIGRMSRIPEISLRKSSGEDENKKKNQQFHVTLVLSMREKNRSCSRMFESLRERK